MNPLELVRIAFKALVRNRLRSFLTTLGIVVGIASVITIVGLGAGAQAMVAEQINKMGANRITLFPHNRMLTGAHDALGANRLTMEDAKAILAECPLVNCLTPQVNITVPVVCGNQNWTTDIRGVGVDFQRVRDWDVATGRFFTEAEVKRAAKVCVICHTVAQMLFGDEDPVGRIIRIKNMPFMVIGLLETKGIGPGGGDMDDDIFAPYTTVMTKIIRTTYISNIQVEARSAQAVSGAEEEMDACMRRRHHIGSDETPDFDVRSQVEVQEVMGKTYGTIALFLISVASIALLVGGIGIMNIMLVSVTERIREIGIRLAVGARGTDILWQFLLEAVVLSIGGGIVGIGAGIASARIVTWSLKWPVLISLEAVLISLFFSASVGLIFGIYPAWKASRLDPIVALRQD